MHNGSLRGEKGIFGNICQKIVPNFPNQMQDTKLNYKNTKFKEIHVGKQKRKSWEQQESDFSHASDPQ